MRTARARSGACPLATPVLEKGRRMAARSRFWTAYPARSRPRTSTERIVAPAVAGLVALLAWWLASLAVPTLLLPGPIDVAARVVEQAANGVASQYLWPTVGPALLGVGIAMIGSIAIGILVTHSRPLASVFEPWVALSQTIPLVAIAPILVLWLGYGTVPIACLCAIVAFFPMVTTTIVGFRHLDVRVLEQAVLDGASPLQRLVAVEIPMAAPAVLAGLRAGSVLGMTGAVVGEFVMGGRGLGTLLTLSRQASDTVGVFTVIVWISAVAMVLYWLVALGERATTAHVQGEDT